PFSVALATIGRCTGSGVPRRLMRAEEEDRSIFVKDVLCSVPVMHIPIGNEDAFGPEALLRVARCDRDVIEQAKPHASRSTGVVPWRPNRAKRIQHGARENRLDR